MRRPIYAIVLICLLALTIPALIAAQDAQPPVTTEEPAPPVVQPTIVTPEVIAPAVPEGVVPIPTAIGGELVPTAAPQPTTPPPAIDPIALPLLLSARSDLELLAGQELGAERPVGWSGSLDVNDPQLALLTRLDLELLVGRLIAPDQRPPGWFGAVPSSTLAIVRDIRHDLELLADTVGVPSVRPAGWTGADPLMRCDRGVQALINVLERGGVFSLNVDGNDPNFCMLAEVQASQFAETSLLSLQNTTITTTTNNPAAPAAPAGQPAPLPGSVQIDTEVAFAFLNRFGTEQVGKIPVGTNVQPVARSFTQFSAMTLVRGQDFEVFIDYRDSSLSDDQFAALPDVNGVSVTTACGAAWCDSVIYTLGNPAAGRTEPPGQPVASGNTTSANSNTSGKTQVPIENLILAYDGQDANNSTVVRMQLCSGSATTAGNICQPVTQVIAPDGSVLQPVGNLNGQSQYRLPYGYSTHSARSANYFLVDVWIHTPEQR